MPYRFWEPYRFPVFVNAGNELLSIKKGYRYRAGPYRLCQVLINSELLQVAHD